MPSEHRVLDWSKLNWIFGRSVGGSFIHLNGHRRIGMFNCCGWYSTITFTRFHLIHVEVEPINRWASTYWPYYFLNLLSLQPKALPWAAKHHCVHTTFWQSWQLISILLSSLSLSNKKVSSLFCRHSHFIVKSCCVWICCSDLRGVRRRFISPRLSKKKSC